MFNQLSAISRMEWVQILDVALASLPIYLAMKALQQATHRRVVVFFLILFSFYLTAKSYRWELTSLFLEFFGIVGVVGFFLVFQEDIRRFLESILYSSFVPLKKQHIGDNESADAVLTSVKEMSENKIGALIVFEGKIPLVHFTKGGFELDGYVSEPLLHSIFDHHSLGHDGAVIIKAKRVSRFGVHLPLPKKSTSRSEKKGTRHAAALGLSEVTDAFIIAVSEESGQVSIARDSSIRVVSMKELEKELGEFLKLRIFAPGLKSLTQRKMFQTIGRNVGMKAASIGLSLLVWAFFVAPVGNEQRTFEIPVTLKNIPPSLIVDDPQPTRATATLVGSEGSFDRWRELNRSITVDLTDIKPGVRKIGLTPENLMLSEGIQLKRFDPTSISVTAHKAKTVNVPIVVSLVGRRPQSLKVKFRTDPELVPVLIRDGDSGPSLVTTEPLEFSKLLQSQVVQVRIIPPVQSQFSPNTPDTVKVYVEGMITPR